MRNQFFIITILAILFGATTIATANAQQGQLILSNNTAFRPFQCLNNDTVCSTSIWQEFAFDSGLINIHVHSGVWHNKAGVFIPWDTLCKAQESKGILLQSCSDLIDS